MLLVKQSREILSPSYMYVFSSNSGSSFAPGIHAGGAVST